MITVTDDYCNSATSDIMDIIGQELGEIGDNEWLRIHDAIFDLLVDKFESNGYMNHN